MHTIPILHTLYILWQKIDNATFLNGWLAGWLAGSLTSWLLPIKLRHSSLLHKMRGAVNAICIRMVFMPDVFSPNPIEYTFMLRLIFFSFDKLREETFQTIHRTKKKKK